MTTTRRYPSFSVPQANRQILCDPHWSAIVQSLANPREARADSDIEILGVPLAKLAREARHDLLVQARTYTQSYAEVADTTEGPLVITGHQPEVVHPGVWLKNFAAAKLAQEVGGTAISLIIDNDLCRAPSIRVPTGTVEQPHAVDILFDQPQPEIPYEDRTIADRSLWNSFGKRVTQALAPFVPDPLLVPWWPRVIEVSKSTPKLGLAMAQARHRQEQAWGSYSLEIPQSQVCQTRPFHQFALHLLSNAARLSHDYNSALADFRKAHRLRSTAQPLPDLTTVEDWIETPFWIWTQNNPIRRALFVQPHPTGLRLSDRHQWQETLPPASGGDFQAALLQLSEWQQQGIRLRSRALITTLYARLLLADTFIHGIGGARYDQVTDVLAERFFGILPPSFATMSGTLRLPIEHEDVSNTRVGELRQRLRQLRYHPESTLKELALDASDQSKVETWVAQKMGWLKMAKTPTNAAERHAQIVDANLALQPWLESRRQKLEQELAALIAQTHKNQVLESREYPFCLFPPDHLRQFLLDFSPHMP